MTAKSIKTLICFVPLSFYTPWKHEKTSGFLIFTVVMERYQSMKWVKSFGYYNVTINKIVTENN